jgi:hypothetical protein
MVGKHFMFVGMPWVLVYRRRSKYRLVGIIFCNLVLEQNAPINKSL